MADEKRTEVICTKLTERMALDLLRAAAAEDRSVSEFLYLLIRRCAPTPTPSNLQSRP